MILQALADYYEALAEKGKISRPGWAKAKVSYALEINENGELLQVYPLKDEKKVGKKTVTEPREIELPAPVKRSSGVEANFLWDNSSYILGIDDKGKPKRTKQCFEAAKALHISLLESSDDKFAKAIVRFFERWEISCARENSALSGFIEDIEAGANLVFMFEGAFPSQNRAISQIWQTYYNSSEEGECMRCLVTGEKVVPMRIHPAIKGVAGAQPSGAALVSFNALAFCSYNRKQNINAPVGKYAAFAYTSALNYLLSDKKHVKQIGDTTLVYWAEDGEPRYQDAFSKFLDGSDDENIMTDKDLDEYMEAIAKGFPVNWEGIPLKPENRFYVLGVSPNAGRLSVRFFQRDGFGSFVRNIKKHYDDIEIVSDGQSKWTNIPLRELLGETVNKNSSDKTSSPQMTGDTLRAVLTGGKYPATLYQQTQLRIKAEREINRSRAAIIKAYLLRNADNIKFKEALEVKLNENTVYQPYVLGRLFYVAEAIQEKASDVTSIKDKYFSSACATPAVVFPIVIDLAGKHLRKLDGGMRTYYEKQFGELMALISESYPAHHNLYEQGIFQLGYYHQKQKRFEKKDKSYGAENTEEVK